MEITIYNLEDGGRIAAVSPAEFVTKLRTGSLFDSDCTDAEYMSNFADRYKIYKNAELRIDTAENFVEDLKKFGYIL